MTSTKYIGMDVHTESISMAVRNASRPVSQTGSARSTQPAHRSVCLRPSCSPLRASDPRSVPRDVAR